MHKEQTSIWPVWGLVPVQLDLDVTSPISIAADFNGLVQGREFEKYVQRCTNTKCKNNKLNSNSNGLVQGGEAARLQGLGKAAGQQ